MGWVIQAIVTGISAFIATNLDDIVILTVLFAQVNDSFRPHQIVIGQYLGFCILLLLSLPGFLGGLVIPHTWLGLLGILPIIIGIRQLLQAEPEKTEVQMIAWEVNRFSLFLIAPQVYSVAAITIANGGDNIGVYVPLFANTNLAGLLVMLCVFLVMIGLWCLLAYWLTNHTAIAPLIVRYGRKVLPFVLIALGIFILVDNYLLEG